MGRQMAASKWAIPPDRRRDRSFSQNKKEEEESTDLQKRRRRRRRRVRWCHEAQILGAARGCLLTGHRSARACGAHLFSFVLSAHSLLRPSFTNFSSFSFFFLIEVAMKYFPIYSNIIIYSSGIFFRSSGKIGSNWINYNFGSNKTFSNPVEQFVPIIESWGRSGPWRISGPTNFNSPFVMGQRAQDYSLPSRPQPACLREDFFLEWHNNRVKIIFASLNF